MWGVGVVWPRKPVLRVNMKLPQMETSQDTRWRQTCSQRETLSTYITQKARDKGRVDMNLCLRKEGIHTLGRTKSRAGRSSDMGG